MLLPACSEIASSINPCSTEGACEVDGVSYVVHDITVDAPFFDEANRHIVAVGGTTVSINYTIRNRGSEKGEEQRIEACLWTDCLSRTVPVLEPGGRASGRIDLALAAERVGDRDLVVTITGFSSARKTLPFRAERPDLVTTVQVADEVLDAVAISAIVTVRNNAFVAEARTSTAELCLVRAGSATTCETGEDRLQIPTGVVPAGSSQVDTLTLPISGSLLSNPDVPRPRRLHACANISNVVTESSTTNNCAQQDFNVFPNLVATCSARDLAPGQSHTGQITQDSCALSGTWSNSARRAAVYRIASPADGTRFDVVIDGEGFSALWTGQAYVSFAVLNERGTVVHRFDNIQAGQQRIADFQVNHGAYFLAIFDRGSGSTNPGFQIHLTQ